MNDRTAFDVISLPIQKEHTSMNTVTDEQRAIAHQLGLDPAQLAQQVALNSRGDGDRSPYVSFSVRDLIKRSTTFQNRDDDIDGMGKVLWEAAARASGADSTATREAAIREMETIFAKWVAALRKV
jgi:hypothetical protein